MLGLLKNDFLRTPFFLLASCFLTIPTPELREVMKTINESEIEQGTSAWHNFRMQGIGGSEIAAVLGISPYQTPLELWEIKTGKVVKEEESNFIFEKGHRLEPKIRAMYEIQTGNTAQPCLVVREDKPEYRASLDGRDPEKKIVVEMKYVGAGEKWLLAQEGKAPDYYYAQMQWQLFITGDEYADYVVYNDKEDKIIINRIDPDIEFIKDMVKKAEKFWKLVQTKKEPELTDRDWKNVRNKELGGLVDRYKKLSEDAKPILDELEVLKKAITTFPSLQHPRSICRGVKIQEITRKGSVDYKKILSEHLPDFDTSGYVKKSTTYRSIKL